MIVLSKTIDDAITVIAASLVPCETILTYLLAVLCLTLCVCDSECVNATLHCDVDPSCSDVNVHCPYNQIYRHYDSKHCPSVCVTYGMKCRDDEPSYDGCGCPDDTAMLDNVRTLHSSYQDMVLATMTGRARRVEHFRQFLSQSVSGFGS